MSSYLGDTTLAELGRFDEAEPALEKAVQLAPPGDELPLNNLARMRRLRQQSSHKPTRNKVRAQDRQKPDRDQPESRGARISFVEQGVN